LKREKYVVVFDRDGNVKFTKTLQINCLKPTARKQEKLDEAMRQFARVADEAAKRLPGLPMKFVRNPRGRGSPLYGIVQDIRNDGVTLNAACAFEAVHKACEAYVAMRGSRNYRRIPRFRRSNLLRFHNRDNLNIEYDESADRCYAVLHVFPRERIVLPLKGRRYQYLWLKAIVNGDLSHGSADLKKANDGKYVLNLTLRLEVPKPNEKFGTICAVDLGMDNIATLTVLRGGEVKRVKFWSGREARHRVRRYWRKKAELQRRGRLDLIRRMKGRLKRWKENLDHKVSRELVEIASRYECPVIVFEQLKGVRNATRKLRGDAKHKQNRLLSSWTFFRLRRLVEYKSAEKGVPVLDVPAKGTSLTCNRCGAEVERPYRGNFSLIKCQRCGYEANADFNAAMNITKLILPDPPGKSSKLRAPKSTRRTVSGLHASARGVPSSTPNAPLDEVSTRALAVM